MDKVKMNVVGNAKRNVIFLALNRVLIMILPFIERTVIRYVLGAEYLGLSSLFTSILSILSLTELGFGTAVVSQMYKPVADGDINKVNSLLRYYRRAYRIVGLIIMVVGLCLVPMLPKLISGSYPVEINITILYFVYLFNTVVSYFASAYLQSILVVYQRDDISSTINSAIKCALTISQIIVLFLTKKYILFATLIPVFTILSNVWLACAVKKKYPYYKCEGIIDNDQKKEMRRIIIGAFAQKSCLVSRNSFDSICISAFMGLTMVAIYNNYYLILNAVNILLAIIGTSILGGIGNHITTRSKEQNYEEMRRLDFIYLLLGGWSTICLLCLYTPFMKLWMGDTMILTPISIICFGVYYYLLKIGYIRSLYTEAKGGWWKQRYRAIVEMILNLVLNITLGYLYGINGIILATAISLFLCDYLWGAWLTFSDYFGTDKLSTYHLYQVRYFLVTILVLMVTYSICCLFKNDNILFVLGYRMIICIIVPLMMYLLIYRKKEELRYVIKVLHLEKK